MSNTNHIQIIGDRVYYKMELVANLNEMSMKKTILDEFKLKLIGLNADKSVIECPNCKEELHCD